MAVKSQVLLLNQLDPVFRERLTHLLDACEKEGYLFKPYVGMRDVFQQNRLWRRSRNPRQVQEMILALRNQNLGFLAYALEVVGPQRNGPWATNAIGGESWHQFGLAADVVRILPSGKADWSDEPYRYLNKKAESFGLSTGLSFKDGGHIQMPKESSPKRKYSMATIELLMRERFGRKQ
jgi:hypothetical protein